MTAAGRGIGLAVLFALGCATLSARAAQDKPSGQGFSFRTGVDLVNVAVTITDASGRFVPNLRREDFVVLEDGKPQPVSQFDSDRVPVSLGIALDTSGSMAGAKIVAAEAALHRFLYDLLDPQDQIFLYRFDSRPDLVQPWTSDRAALMRALGAIQPRGGTAIYDTIAEAIPLTQAGTLRKKALLLISDGQDTSSRIQLDEARQLIRQSEVLVYAIGIDGETRGGSNASSKAPATRPGALPVPSPFPGKSPAASPTAPSLQRVCGNAGGSTDRVNADALHQITDDSGGRTEIICSQQDLDPATAGIADELRRQYFLGYISAAPKDGRWHAIEVRLKNATYHVRARHGFIAG